MRIFCCTYKCNKASDSTYAGTFSATASNKTRALEKLNSRLSPGLCPIELDDVTFEELSLSMLTPNQLDDFHSNQH